MMGAKESVLNIRVRRNGARPSTTDALPHLQTNQWPDPEWNAALIRGSSQLAHIVTQQSRMAPEDTIALRLLDEFAFGPREAFIDDHEFCYLHPLPEGCLHLTLPTEARRSALELGWAEPHPAVRIGCMHPTVVMVYAPRNPEELTVVMDLIRISLHFAEGFFT
jgi:hypothetical protein